VWGMSLTVITEIPRTHNPYPRHGVQADGDGIPRYTGLPGSLIAMLGRQVETGPDVEAVIEVGGPRLTYRQLWDRAARVAGGLPATGVARGDRVAVRYPAGVNWVLAFWGTLMAGGVAVAVNTRSSPPEVDFVRRDAGVTVDLAADSPLPDGDPLVVRPISAPACGR
jgi:acyl-CoA synthetase (AMP-forming)/AMP-acid ligase II